LKLHNPINIRFFIEYSKIPDNVIIKLLSEIKNRFQHKNFHREEKGGRSLETYTEPNKMVENLLFQEQRLKILSTLPETRIDEPMVEIVTAFNKLPYCFTLQCCYGHFVYKNDKRSYSTKPLSVMAPDSRVEYQIAYIAFCIENNPSGRSLFKSMEAIPGDDHQNIQFCGAEWFWERQVNSYALQVEPDRFKHKDSVTLDFEEALLIENVRNAFFVRLKELFLNLKLH